MPGPNRRAVLMGAAAGAGALGLGVGLSWPRLAATWSRPGAILDADLAGGRFVFAGRNYPTRAAFLAAAGGAEAAGAIAIGPFAIPGAAEKVVNGDFAGGTTGWSTQNGGSLAVAGGLGVLSGNGGNIPGFQQLLALEQGHAYQLRGKIQRIVGQPVPAITVSANSGLGGVNAAHLTDGGTTLHELTSTFGAQLAAMYVGGRYVANPANGDGYFDDISVKEVLPFAGYVAGQAAGIVSGVTPSAASGSKVVLELSCGGTDAGTPHERNRVRLEWDAGKHLRLVITSGNAEQANLDLGVVEVSTPFAVLFSARTNDFRAALRGGPLVLDSSGTFPGIAMLYLKRQNATGSSFDGTLDRVTLFPAAWSEAEFYERLADTHSIAMWGDSLTAGANASNDIYRPPQAAALLYDPDRSIVNLGIGGQTSTQIAARMGAQPIAVTVSGDQLPASGGVAVTTRSINVLYNSGTYSGSQKGWLAGVYGTMTTDGAGNWTFTREAAGPAGPCPSGSVFTPELGQRLRNRVAWLWLGRNGAQAGHTVEGDIAAAVASLGHDRYLVGAILTSAGDSADGVAAILARNATLAATYGSRFVDVFAALAGANDGSPADLADVAAGHTPGSLRSDAIHLNDGGYAIVAAAFKARNDAMGW